MLNKKNIPENREFTLDHNYVFDFNFYLSRIREGQERRWLVSEKYYHKEHLPSLFQILYLYMGKLGGLFGLDPTTIYHGARIIFGLVLLISILTILGNLWDKKKTILIFLLVATGGSWPILVKVTEGISVLGYRCATYMGWWSSQDSLQRITYIPHVLVGQILLLWFIKCHSEELATKNPVGIKTAWLRMTALGILGVISGIIFPPALIILYAWFGVESILEFLLEKKWLNGQMAKWLKNVIVPRVVFFLLSVWALIYAQVMFQVLPWSTLATFDIRHRMPLPLKDYILSLGPVFVLGVLGGVGALWKKEKKMYPFVSWIVANFLLIFLFWNVPTQSPLRFTQSAIYIPSGILAGYFFIKLISLARRYLGNLRHLGYLGIGALYCTTIAVGLFVMVSMVGWLTDQVVSKRTGTFLYPTGAVLIYPTKDFMSGIYFLKDQTNQKSVVLSAETAGNFIPAYAGNYVYYGHANTPDDDEKKKIIEKFFSGKMSQEEAGKFLKSDGIRYVYFGPQEREFASNKDLTEFYPFLKEMYSNKNVILYRI